MTSFLILFLLSLCLSYIEIYGMSKIFYRFNVLDNPKKYGKKRKPIPYSMGVVFYGVFFVLSLLFIELDEKLLLILGF